MGTLVGHVAPGFGFLVIGLWHLFNHVKLHVQNPKTYHSLPWFPSTKIRYLELFLIMISCSISIAMELFIGPDRHQPLDTDGTIPSNHLHNFEHSFISMTFLVYAVFAIILDKYVPKVQYELTQLLASIAFAQQLLLFHLHSADHMGVEGQYHMLLQILILISLITTIMGINYQKSFIVSFIRSISIFFQGLWLMVMGFMLWTKSLIPKGCFLNLEEGHHVVRCHENEALERAKSLVNIQFSWYLICVTIFAMTLYLAMHKFYEGRVEYEMLRSYDQNQEKTVQDIEAQTKEVKFDQSKSILHIEKSFGPVDMER
uniref:transmembrane protein 45B-like n=1 Tax=Erigeron canadensis TaxID=72917 RepID=UPI001CB89D2E|nr:transmembrane protein 45B-like [Erigeron canadensis]